MGRFHRRISLLGRLIGLNLSKIGISFSVGERGFHERIKYEGKSEAKRRDANDMLWGIEDSRSSHELCSWMNLSEG
jgi:hypothetical protein